MDKVSDLERDVKHLTDVVHDCTRAITVLQNEVRVLKNRADVYAPVKAVDINIIRDTLKVIFQSNGFYHMYAKYDGDEVLVGIVGEHDKVNEKAKMCISAAQSIYQTTLFSIVYGDESLITQCDFSKDDTVLNCEPIIA